MVRAEWVWLSQAREGGGRGCRSQPEPRRAEAGSRARWRLRGDCWAVVPRKGPSPRVACTRPTEALGQYPLAPSASAPSCKASHWPLRPHSPRAGARFFPGTLPHASLKGALCPCTAHILFPGHWRKWGCQGTPIPGLLLFQENGQPQATAACLPACWYPEPRRPAGCLYLGAQATALNCGCLWPARGSPRLEMSSRAAGRSSAPGPGPLRPPCPRTTLWGLQNGQQVPHRVGPLSPPHRTRATSKQPHRGHGPCATCTCKPGHAGDTQGAGPHGPSLL